MAGISPNIRSYTVYIYGSGQPYTLTKDLHLVLTLARAPLKRKQLYVDCVVKCTRPEISTKFKQVVLTLARAPLKRKQLYMLIAL